MQTVSNSRQPAAVWTVAVVFLALFGWFVWPTSYRYDHIRVGQSTLPVRINRISGVTEILYPSGWKRPTDSTPPRATTSLTGDDLAKLTGNANIQYGVLKAEIYNGTRERVKEITISVTLSNQDGTVEFTRLYRLTRELGTGDPLSATTYSAIAGFTPSSGQTWTWRVVDAAGEQTGQ